MKDINLITLLNSNPIRNKLLSHPLFEKLRECSYEKEDVAYMLGQWWHPLHYFPTFLAKCIATLPTIEAKSAITRILAQEVGNGKASKSHESIYVQTMTSAGFSKKTIIESPMSDETAKLLNGFSESSEDKANALGFIFATEVVDLVLVRSIGIGVKAVTGIDRLPWVDIHLLQEPDHVKEADNSLLSIADSCEVKKVCDSADNAWRLWVEFFDHIEMKMW